MYRPVIEAHSSRRAAVVLFNQPWGVEEDDCVVRDRHMAVDRPKVRLVPFAGLRGEGLGASKTKSEMLTTSKEEVVNTR